MAGNTGEKLTIRGGQLRLEVNGASVIPIKESKRVPRVGFYCDAAGQVVAIEGCTDCMAAICSRRAEYGLGPKVLESVAE